jgi:hypothetical protein
MKEALQEQVALFDYTFKANASVAMRFLGFGRKS